MVFDCNMDYDWCMVFRMKLVVFLCALAAVALLSLPVRAIESASTRSYQSIIDRNPFNLKPPPPPATNAAPEAPPPPKVEILLTGYSTITRPKRAYLMSKEPNKKDPYFSLAEGQAKDGIEVLEIDEKAKSVKIRNAGVENILTFAKNGITNPPAVMQPMPGGIPGQPGVQPPVVPGQPQAFFPNYQNNPQPNGTVPANAYNANNNIVRSIPSRTLRTPDPVPTINSTVAPGTPQSAAQRNVPSMSAEEQYLMLKVNEAQQTKAFQKGLVPAPPPPLPPLFGE